jgi:adenosyl cobinamide kinase/adenosyl cobinamide phosphate guanylyltransferase
VITLVVGGARSGKSEVAERLASRLPAPVTYVATATTAPGDDDMAVRIANHQARRPGAWRTVEACDSLPTLVAGLDGTVLLDALGPWVAATRAFSADASGLCRALQSRHGDTVVVSEEVGLGVHPSTEAGRHFRDALGEVNQAVAGIADEVLLVVAGRTLHLERP